MDKFNERLKLALEYRNLTQAELSELTGIPKPSISQYLSGYYMPKRDRIVVFAKALHVNEAWLNGYDVPMEEAKNNAEQIFYDFIGINTALANFPATDTNVLDTKAIYEALTRVMEINEAYLSTPRLYSTTISVDEAIIGLKFILAYYGINLEQFSNNELRTIVENPLFGNFIVNILPPQKETE